MSPRAVATGSAAARRNVAQAISWKLVSINDMEISTPADVRTALDGVAPGQIVSLHFVNPFGDTRVSNVRMP